MKKFWAGTDYGTANPTHFNLLGLGKDNRFYLIDEWRHSGAKSGRSKTDVEYSQHLQEWLDDYKTEFSDFVPQWIFIDPSAKSFITQVNRDTSFRVSKADNTVLDGIRKVSKLLGTDNLKIHKRCENTINEFHSYAWDDNAQEKGDDKPLKSDDHSMDALRYIVNSIGKQYQYVLRS
jgi:PBSX family phage terminase large subunit